MSKQIDEKVVEMRFNNANFEKNVQTTMSTLDKLKEKLSFKGAAKGLESLDTAVKKVDMSRLGNSVEAVSLKFNGLYTIGDQYLRRLTDSAIAAGTRITKALTIQPITTGFNEYELKMDSVRTIMASTGEDVKAVNKYLEELNEYSDQTIYSFSDMTQNIGKFTNAGVKLEDAVLAIKGISNEAAVSGANANEASRAMYNFAQALSAGYVKLIDWKSIELANMATKEFKEQLLQSAVAAGTLTKSSDGMYKTLKGNTLNATKDFNDSLKDEWMTTEVLIGTLKDYADSTTEIGKKAFAAAQDVTKLSQMFDVLKETAQSGWAKTWELIFGDINQAKAIFTPLTNFFSKIIDKMSDFRNNLLEGALSSPLTRLAEKISSVTAPVTTATKKLQDFSDIVNSVIRGNYGNGQSRFEKLAQAGYDWAHVQNLVNEKLGNSYRYATKYTDAQGELIEQTIELTDAKLKELGLTNDEIEAYRELETQAKKSGKTVNELIEEMDQMDGRTMLIKTMSNAGSGLIGIFKALKDAWVEIFPPMTSTQLYNIISLLYNFSEKLRLTDEKTGELNETGQKIKRTFKGVVAILKIMTTLFGGPLSIAFKIVGKILEAMGTSFLDVTAVIGDALVKFSDWLDSLLDFTKVFEKIKPAIEKVVELLREFGNVVKGAFSGWAKAIKESDFVQSIVSGFANGLRSGASKVWDAAVEFGRKIIEAVKNVLGIHSPSTEFADMGEDCALGMAGGLGKGWSYIINAIKTMFSSIGDAFSKMNWSEISANFLLFSSIFPQSAIAKWGTVLSRYFSSIGVDTAKGLASGIAEGAKSAVAAIVSVATAIVTAIKNALGIHSPSTVMITIGKFLIAGLIAGILAKETPLIDVLKTLCSKTIDFIGASLGKLNAWLKGTEWPEIKWEYILGIAAISGIVVFVKKILNVTDTLSKGVKAFGDGVNKFGNLADAFANRLNGATKSKFENFGDTVFKLSLSIAMLSAAIYVLAQLDAKQMWSAVGAITVLGGVLVALGVIANKANKGGSDGLGKLALLVLSLAASLFIISKAVGSLANTPFENLMGALTIVGGLILLVTMFSKITAQGGGVLKASATLLALSIAIGILVKLMSAIDKLTPAAIENGLVVIGGLMTFLALFVVGVSMYGGQTVKIGGTLLGISLALGILVGLFFLIDKLDPATVQKGAIVIGGLMTFLGLFIVGVNAACPGGQAAKVGGSLLALSTAIAILVGLFFLINKLDDKPIVRGIVVMGVLMIFLGLFIKGINKACPTGQAAKVGTALLALAGALAILTIVLSIMSMLSWTAIGKGLAVMTGLGLILSLMLYTAKNAAGAEKAIMMIAVSIGVMAAAVALLSFLDPAKLAGATICVSVLMGLFALMEAAASKAYGSTGAILAMTVVIAAIAGAIYLVAQLPVEQALGSTAALSIMMLSMSAALLIVGQAGKHAKDALLGALGLLALAVPLLAFVGILYVMQGVQNATTNAIALAGLATALTLLLIPLSIVGVIIGASGGMALLGIVGLLALAIPLLAFVGILYAMQGLDNAMANVQALVVLMNALTNMLVVVSILGPLALIGTVAIGAMTGLMVALGALVVGLGALFSEVSSLEGYLDKGLAVLEKLATGIGKALGGFVSGFATAVVSGLPEIGLMLSQFMTNATPFIVGAKMIDDSVTDGVKSLAETFLILTGANILDTMTKWLTGGSSLDAFGQQLGSLGGHLRTFADELGTFDEGTANTVACAANAIKAMAQAAEALPNEGGWLAKMVGDNNIGAFGAQLPMLGMHLSLFALALGTFDDAKVKTVDCAAKAIKAIAESAESLPNEGGWLGKIVGENNIAEFGAKLPGLGSNLSLFVANLGTFTDDQVKTTECAANAIKAIAQAAEALPNEGGWLGKICGENGIDDFGGKLPGLGEDISDFADAAGDISTEKVNNAVNVLKSLTSLVDVDLTDAGDKLSSLGGVLGDFGSKLQSFATTISAVPSDKLSNAVGKIKEVVSAISEISTSNTSAVKDLATSLKDLGQNGVKNFMGAFASETNRASVKEAINGMLNAAINAIKSKTVYDNFTDCGKYCVKGFIAGLEDSKLKIRIQQAAKDMAKTAEDAANQELEVNSPSKKFVATGASVIEGFVQGIKKNTGDAEDASSTLGTDILSAFQKTLEINSPSLVMDKQGHWIVQGVAEGIKKDMSAEEAMEKKAQNIANAFQKYFDQNDLYSDILNKELEHWKLGKGKYASDSEIEAKELEYMNLDMEHKLANQSLAYDKWKQMVSYFGETSKQAKEAWSSYYDAQIEVLKLQDSIADMGGRARDRQYEELENAMDIRSKLQGLWEIKDGDRLTFEEKLARYLKDANADLEDLNKQLVIDQQKHEEAINKYDAQSEEVLEAWNKAYQTELAIAEKKQEIAELQESSITNEIESIDRQMELRNAEYNLWEEKVLHSNIPDSRKDEIMDSKLRKDLSDYEAILTQETDLLSTMAKGTEEYEEQMIKITNAKINVQRTENELTQLWKDAATRELESLKEQYNLAISTADLQYQIWEATTGRKATTAEKDIRKISTLSQQLMSQSQLLETARKEWVKAKNEYGKSSNEAQNAYNNYLQKQLDIAELQNEITDINEKTVARQKLASSQYADYIKKYEKYYSMNGMSRADLERDAKLVSGYNPDTTVGNMVSNTNAALEKVQNSSEYKELLENFSNMGNSYVDAVNSGVADTTSAVLATITGMLEECVTVMREQRGDWIRAGSFLGEGLVMGIRSRMSKVINTVIEMCEAATATMQSELDMHSPSRVFFEFGANTVLGFANGLLNKLGVSNSAISTVGESAVANFGKTIRNIADLIESDIDTQPTIRPVLDLSSVESSAARLNTMFSTAQAMSINASMSRPHKTDDEIQNGDTTPAGNSYQFVQNNYSPKALSRTEIYRQTKNQFAAMKGALS